MISSSSPGPITSAEEAAGLAVFCSAFSFGGVVTIGGFVAVSPFWTGLCGLLFCAEAACCQPRMLRKIIKLKS